MRDDVKKPACPTVEDIVAATVASPMYRRAAAKVEAEDRNLREQATFGGIPLVFDERIPEGYVYVVPRPPPLPNETYAAYEARCARMGIKLVNLAPAPR